MVTADEKGEGKRLTPEQIENWRKILVRNKMQARIDRMEERKDHADL